MTGERSDVHAVRCDCRARREVLRELRRRAVRGPPRRRPRRRRPVLAGVRAADCGNGTYVDEYCTVCGNRRAEPDRDEDELDGIVLVTDRGLEHAAQRGRRRSGHVAGGVGRQRSPLWCATGCPRPRPPSVASSARRTAGVERCSTHLPRSRSRRRPYWPAGRRGEGGGGRGAAPGSGNRAVVHLTGGGRRADLGGAVQIAVGNVGDSRVVLAARTARAAADA